MRTRTKLWRIVHRHMVDHGIRSQRELAELLGMTEWALCRRLSETTKFTPAELTKLCEVLGIRRRDLI